MTKETKHRERRGRIELPSRAWHARTLPPSYHRKYEKRAAGIEPASTVWKTVALPLDDARVRLFQTVTLVLPFYLRAARENCTRRLLHTRQVPRCLGLSSDRGATGSRTPIPAVRKQCSPIELSSHSDRHFGPPAPQRRIELPSPDRQSGRLTRCVQGQTLQRYDESMKRTVESAGVEPATS